jgi:hypothetical protein
VDLFDVLPTCLDVCGLEYNGAKYKLSGESLCSAAPQRNRNVQISSYSTGAERWVMCRNKRYKYIYKYNQGFEEMYDLLADPQEMYNLLKEEAAPLAEYGALKAEAVRYEKQWGPEPLAESGTFCKIDGKAKPPTAASKYAMSSNRQVQKFDTRNGQERGEAFLRELEHALTFEGVQRPAINEVCNHPIWKQSMIESFAQYAPDVDIESKLFKSNSTEIKE